VSRSYTRTRIAFWFVLVGILSSLNYVARFTSTAGRGDRNALYTYSAALSGLVFYAIFFGFVYALAAVDTPNLFALRRPTSWPRALGLCLSVLVGIYVWSGIVSLLPLPQSPGQEQGLAPKHWEPSHAGAYAANFLVIAIVAPFVEELTFRGVGFGLLERFGLWLASGVIGIMFGLAHGAIEGLLVFIPLGAALAVVRARTASVVPGMLVHGAFNAVALLYVLTT
jgi:membrane protease YdiL (CAAX protease family)